MLKKNIYIYILYIEFCRQILTDIMYLVNIVFK